MQPRFRNNTKLTLDLFKYGVSESFKASHKLLRAISISYGFIMIFAACVLLDYDTIFATLFFVLGFGIIFWTLAGYKIGTKRSFMNFAKLHNSHYQIDMEFRFYDDRLEQETEKTELTVMYKDISDVCDLDEILIFNYKKQVIILEKSAFIDCNYEDVIKFLKERKIKVR